MFSTISVILSLNSRAHTVTALNCMKISIMSMNRDVILLRRNWLFESICLAGN